MYKVLSILLLIVTISRTNDPFAPPPASKTTISLKRSAESFESLLFSNHKNSNTTKVAASQIDGGWLNAIKENIAKSEYDISYNNKSKSWQSGNRAQKLFFNYNLNGFEVTPFANDLTKKQEWKIALQIIGLSKVTTESFYGELFVANKNMAFVEGNIMKTEYENKESGMRQNFIIKKQLEGTGNVKLKLSVTTDLKFIADSAGLAFKKEGGSNAMYYNNLSVWDAKGNKIKSWFELEDKNNVIIAYNDQDITYPVTIDPLSSTASWSIESNVANMNLGVSVSSAGDVNGDGYSDVIVGAHHYSNGQSSEGAAFVYHGSATGLSTTAACTLESNVASSSFGSSVSSAGDVNGDGYSDVIVGAPYYANGQSDEGASYVYHGSSTGISTTVAWTIESNTASRSFGCSVSAAGDVNGDGYSDVIVGEFGYSNGQSSEGAAYVYHGSASGLAGTSAWTFESNIAFARFGASVSSAGDVNGDGYSDVIVGADAYSNGQGQEGAAYVFHGSSTGLSATAACTLESNLAGAYSGTSVSSAGDVNGDGYSDAVVGARNYSNGQASEGAFYVFHGSSTGLSTTVALTVESNTGSARLGFSVSEAGDINSDGYSDIIAGAPGYTNGNTGEGSAFVYQGSSTGLSSTASWSTEANIDWADLGVSVSSAGDVNGDGYSDIIVGAENYANGQSAEGAAFVYNGSASSLSPASKWLVETNLASTGFGFSVSSAGDVNGDGYSDVIVGASYYTNGQSNEGAAFVYHGSATGLSTSASWTVESNVAGLSLGYSVSCAGDVNGDGYNDVIVGAYNYSNGQSGEGAAFVYHGSATGLSTTAACTLESNVAGAASGWSVSSAGDVNGDGYSDVIVGAPYYTNGQSNEGAAYVYHGSATGLSTTTAWLAESNWANSYFGSAVSSAGDVNGDGYSDVLVGAFGYNSGGTFNEGAAYVYLGSSTGLSASAAWNLEGNVSNVQFGVSVSSAGDVNGDGFSDVIVGENGYANGQSNEGAAFVYHGSATGLSTTANWIGESNIANAYSGASVSSAGDVNGDGYSDVVIGANNYTNGQSNEGAAYVYHGSSSGLSSIAAWAAESNNTFADYGASVASAGDVNGDGYSDVIIGADAYTNGQSLEGAAYSYYGNLGQCLRSNPRLYNNNLSTPITQSDISSATFGGALFGKCPLGRVNGKLVWEVQKQGVAFNSAGGVITNSVAYSAKDAAYTNLGTTLTGVELKSIVTKAGRWNRVRFRVQFSPITAVDGRMYSRWHYRPEYSSGQYGFSSDPLPVELIRFVASPLENKTQLNWSTASEINNDYFTIERSVNGNIFETIATVKGAGNSSKKLNYETLDSKPAKGLNYYRLKQTDFDGKHTYSKTEVVDFYDVTDSFYLFPNPSSSNEFPNLHVRVSPNDPLLVVLYDITGKEYFSKIILTQNSEENIFAIDPGHSLSKGIYYIIATSSDNVYKRKLVIQ